MALLNAYVVIYITAKMENGLKPPLVKKAKPVKMVDVLKKVSKKADLEISTFIEIIIFVVIFLIIVLPFIAHIWNYFVEKPDSGTMKSFEAMIIESNNLKDEKEVPVYIDKGHIIKTFPKGTGPVDKCKADFGCICVCIKEKGCTSQGRNECKTIESSFLQEYTINPALSREGKATLQNCLLKMVNEQISISKCI